MWTWLKIVFSPGTIVRVLNAVITLLELVKEHPEYSDKAREILGELKAYFGSDLPYQP